MVPMIPMAPLDISIHAPREGGDRLAAVTQLAEVLVFQSTPPRGGRQAEKVKQEPLFRISIHAPREGGDKWCEKIVNGEKTVISIHAPARGATLYAKDQAAA